MKKILGIIMLGGIMLLNNVSLHAQKDEKKCSKSCCENKNSKMSKEEDVNDYSDTEIIKWAMGLHHQLASQEYTKLRISGQTRSSDGTTIEEYWCLYKCNEFVTDLLIDFYDDVAYLDMMYDKNHPTYKHEIKVLEENMYEDIDANKDCGCYMDMLTEE